MMVTAAVAMMSAASMHKLPENLAQLDF